MQKLKHLFLLMLLSVIPLAGFADYKSDNLSMKVGDIEVLYAPSTPDSKYPTLSAQTSWSWSGPISVTKNSNGSAVKIEATGAGTAKVTCDAVFWDASVMSSHHTGFAYRTMTWYITIESSDIGGGGTGSGGSPFNGDKDFKFYDNVTSSTEEGIAMTFWLYEDNNSEFNVWPCSVQSDDAWNSKAAISKSTSGKVTIPEIVPGTKGCSVKNPFNQISVDLDGLIVRNIGHAAFYECKNLTEVVIPSSVKSISNGAFYECTSLEQITLLTSSPPDLDKYAFMQDAYSRVIIRVPKGAKSAYQKADVWKTFKNILEEGESTAYKDGDTFTAKTKEGVWMTFQVISAAKKTCSSGIYTPDFVQAVHEQTGGTITIPSSANGFTVVEIANNAFRGCPITSVSIPNTVTGIGKQAFYGCKNLSSIQIPNSVVLIGENAFEGCSGLGSITLPNSVKSIGSSAFARCNQSDVYSEITEPFDIETSVFYEITTSDTRKLYVPDGTKLKYKKRQGWTEFSKIVDNGNPATATIATFSSPIVEIAVGGWHSFAVTQDGTLWAWGKNDVNQGGFKGDAIAEKPIIVMTDVASVSSNLNYTYIVKKDGTLWACGSGGSGSTSTSKIPEAIKIAEDVIDAVGGYYSDFICLKKDGTVWSSNATSTEFTKIADNVSSIGYGAYSKYFVKKDGTLWGNISWREWQLTDGTSESVNNFVKITDNVSHIGKKMGSHLMVIKTDGTLWTAGKNHKGQLADNTTEDRNYLKKVADDVVFAQGCWYNSIVIKKDGTLWGCGDNSYGQLGDGTTNDTPKLKKITDEVVSAAIGLGHTLILKKDGSLWACGRNSDGQLGDGTLNDRLTPVKIIEGVTVIEPTKITVSPSAKTIKIGESFTADYTLTPSDATTTVTWSSANPDIATVDQSGNVTGVKAGKTTITATTANGLSSSCSVTVEKPVVKPTSISLPAAVELTVDDIMVVKAEVLPADAAYTLTWTSEDEKVVRVKNDGTIMALKEGTTFVNVRTDNGLSDFCKVVVKPIADGIVNATSERDGVYSVHTLSGQRLAAPRKGINIINGKKVVVK